MRVNLDEWRYGLLRRRSKATVELYISRVRNFLTWLGNRPLNAQSVDSYLTHLMKEGKHKNTIYIYFETIKMLFRWMGREKELEVVEPPRFERDVYENQDFLTDDEVIKLINGIKNERDRALVTLMIDTGLRRNEVSSLNVGDVNLRDGTITVRRSKRRGRPRVEEVSIRSNLTKELLRVHISSKKQQSINTPLFTNRRGERLTPNGIYYIVRRYGLGILGKPLHPHTLRHTAGSQIVRATGSVKLVAEHLGITPQVAENYSHISRSEVRKLLPDIMPNMKEVIT